MKKYIVFGLLFFTGCATLPETPSDNSNLDKASNAVAVMETAVNIGCPLAAANVCLYDTKNCDSVKQSCTAAKNAIVVAKDILASAKVANDNSGDTLSKILVGVAEASKYVNDVNALSVSVGGKPILVPGN